MGDCRCVMNEKWTIIYNIIAVETMLVKVYDAVYSKININLSSFESVACTPAM